MKPPEIATRVKATTQWLILDNKGKMVLFKTKIWGHLLSFRPEGEDLRELSAQRDGLSGKSWDYRGKPSLLEIHYKPERRNI